MTARHGIFGLLALLLTWLPLGVRAAERPVDLELVLAVDVSRSMDLDEQKLQREGYAAAFRHDQVIKAIKLGGWGRIAVTYVEWAGFHYQRVTVPWTEIHDRASSEAFAARIAALPPLGLIRTSISGALIYSASLFGKNQVKGLRRVIDVSGDGPNNGGPVVTVARDQVVARGITINGLALMLKSGLGGYFDIVDLDQYYRHCVIGGGSAFLLTVRDKSRFAEAIRRKLVLEIAGAMPPAPAPVLKVQFKAPQRRTLYDCLIGEKMYRKWRSMDPY
jgi:hypothetical protein